MARSVCALDFKVIVGMTKEPRVRRSFLFSLCNLYDFKDICHIKNNMQLFIRKQGWWEPLPSLLLGREGGCGADDARDGGRDEGKKRP